MPKKASRNTKNKIVSTAWSLFYKYGFDNTTIEDIVYESGTSRGSFYHYFSSKDELLNTLSDLFDSKYEELSKTLSDDMSALEKLLYMNKEQFAMIDDSVPLDLLARMYSSQLTTSGSRNLLDHNRTYYKLIRQVVIEGKEKGEFTEEMSVNDIVGAYAMCERALISDWCLSNGEYSLSRKGEILLPRLLKGFLKSK